MQRPVDNNANNNQPGNNQHSAGQYTEGEDIASLFSLVGAWLSPPALAEGKSP